MTSADGSGYGYGDGSGYGDGCGYGYGCGDGAAARASIEGVPVWKA